MLCLGFAAQPRSLELELEISEPGQIGKFEIPVRRIAGELHKLPFRKQALAK